MRVIMIAAAVLGGCGGASTAPSGPAPNPTAACEKGDVARCVELMEYADSSADFTRYGSLACEHGDGAACEFVGLYHFIRSRAPEGSEEFSSLRASSIAALKAGCELGRELPCAYAKLLGTAPETTWDKQTLAQAACKAGDSPVACALVAAGQKHSEDKQNERLPTKKGHAVATMRMCLSERGRVSGIDLLLSTRDPRSDRMIIEKMRKWAYKPTIREGEAIPVCTTVTLLSTDDEATSTPAPTE